MGLRQSESTEWVRGSVRSRSLYHEVQKMFELFTDPRISLLDFSVGGLSDISQRGWTSVLEV